MRASLLTIGDELLLGQVVDTNAAWIGSYLNEQGISLVSKATVGDEAGEIKRGLTRAAEDADIVLLTGGLGPTTDDITLEVLADHLGLEYVFNEETYARIKHIFEVIIKRPLSDSHRTQAYNPAGATTLNNQQGTAPGIYLRQGATTYVAMPGVPREMKYLMEHEVVPRLLLEYPIEPRRQVTLLTAGWGETQLASAIASVLERLPPHVKIAYLPGLGTVRLRLNATGEDAEQLDIELTQLADEIEALLPKNLVFGRGVGDIVSTVHALLLQRGATVSTAESCTGGRLAHLITQQAGASKVFVGGTIAYANSVKAQELGVSEATLAAHGAVSEATVKEMALGAQRKYGTDYAVSTSGIAGPGGGTPDKPVGTVWIAVAGPGGEVRTKLLSLGRDRATNIAYSANAGLNVLRHLLLEA